MTSDYLFRYFAGKLSEKETEKVMRWSEASEANRERLFNERKVFDVLMLQDKTRFEEQLAARKRTGLKIIFPLKTLRRIAAIAVIAVITSWGTLKFADHWRIYPEQTISVPAGQRLDITLPDGSKVCLNGRSSLTYPLAFNRRERKIKLDGQAYFDVMHNESIPFVVSTEKGRIEVMGTKFDVMDFAGQEQFEAALMEGKVKVSLNTSPEEAYTITPDMKIYLKEGKLVREYIEDYYTYLWRDGLIGFKEASFAQIMQELQKNYDIHIVVENNHLSDVSYTGKFRTADGIDYALKVLQKDVKFTYTRNEDHKTIYIR